MAQYIQSCVSRLRMPRQRLLTRKNMFSSLLIWRFVAGFHTIWASATYLLVPVNLQHVQHNYRQRSITPRHWDVVIDRWMVRKVVHVGIVRLAHVRMWLTIAWISALTLKNRGFKNVFLALLKNTMYTVVISITS